MDAGSLVVADLDGTLVGDDESLRRFAAWHAANRDGYRLVYASGRIRPSILELMAATDLPTPDAMISGVGTEIHDDRGRAWPGWLERLAGFDAEAVHRALAPFRWLDRQPDRAQTPLKASYDVPGLSDGHRDEIRRALVRAGIDGSIVYSGGLHLDVLPAAAGKGVAASVVADTWGFAPERVMVVGDTGNDIDLFRRGFRGTVVANALPELTDRLGPETYRSPLPYAAGVLDGIEHWFGAGPERAEPGESPAVSASS